MNPVQWVAGSLWAHWIIVPIVLPLMLGAALILLERTRPGWVGALSVLGVAALLVVNLGLLAKADTGQISAYLLSNWKAPFGIALALDRLTALMLVLTSVVALAALVYARAGDDRRGALFHSFFQFQLMGLNGAFLTADLFNLFVFFEVLLISSYALLLHGAGAARLKASVHYITFNLAASALFLIAVSLLYGLTGTLNMADLAVKVPQLGAENAQLVQAAALLLMVVFAVKAALLPLYFWLPDTYSAATAPAAALFAIMTKVGLYSIVRTSTLIFGSDAGAAAGTVQPWLAVLALLTLLLAALGTLAATRLRGTVAYGVVASAGILLLSVGLAQADTVSAGLFYMVNSTLAACAMFLVADRVMLSRPVGGDTLAAAAFGADRQRLGVMFFIGAVAVAGLPPLAGFFGKALLLKGAADSSLSVWVWAVVLISSLLLVVAFARAGASLFWESGNERTQGAAFSLARELPVWALLGLLVLTSVMAGSLSRYTQATAEQLFERQTYIRAVLGKEPVPPVHDIRKEMNERVKAGGEK
ncbi:monovalent cation/H+ antiporter subunit D [Piscinibacterium candidicorallinum]|uniref:Monovalent cation/H+ antiporter subunit D n=1 Tax=Piscinibacterium candidicorallinum TaxID=1793872 RepID=A0ABV7H7H9_9BURK